MYNCPGGVLLVPAPRCVGPECTGGRPGETKILGYQGDLDAGSNGSFARAGRLAGLCVTDGREIQQGLAAIDDLRRDGEIDRYYAASAKRAFGEAAGPGCDRDAPFAELTPFGAPLAPNAMARAYVGKVGEDVGPDVRDACRCTPRPFDARDPISGWGIYYVPGGVLLTPSEKCIGGAGRPLNWYERTWNNVVSLVKPTPPQPPPLPQAPPAPTPTTAPAIPPAPKPPPPGGYLCLDPRIWPPLYRGQPTPCEAPKIPYPGQ
jgi:hypothetical protein